MWKPLYSGCQALNRNYESNGIRFYFFSREEPRMHVHIYCGDGEAQIELARNYRLSRPRLREIEQIIERHYDEIRTAWQNCFGR